MRPRKLQRSGSYSDQDDALFLAKLKKLTSSSSEQTPAGLSCLGSTSSFSRSCISVSSVRSQPPPPPRFPSTTNLIPGGNLVQVLSCLAKQKIDIFKHYQVGLPVDLRTFNKALRLTRKGAQQATDLLTPASRSAQMRSLVLWCSHFWALLVELQSLCSQRCSESRGSSPTKTHSFAWLLDEKGLGSDIRSALVSALPFSFVDLQEASVSSSEPKRVLPCALCGPDEPLPRGSVCVQPCHKHSFCAECLVRALPSARVDFSPSSRLLHSSPCILFFCPLCSRQKSQSVTRHNALLSFCLMLWLCEKLTRPGSLPGLPLQDLRRADLLVAFERQQRAFSSKQWLASQTSASLRVLVDEAVLTSKCPSCKKRCVNPLVDPSHSECLVVTCEACEHQFCGWCHFGLGNSGGQGREYKHTLALIQHHHVKQCCWNPDKNNLYISAAHRKQCEVMLRAFAHRLVHDRVLAARPDLQGGCLQNKKLPEHWSCLWCGKENSNSSGVCLGCGHNLFPWFISRLKKLLNV